MSSPLRSPRPGGHIAQFQPAAARAQTAEVPVLGATGARQQKEPPKETVIRLDLPANIAVKFQQAAAKLGYGFQPRTIRRLRKPALSFHQICGANTFINLIYWDHSQTIAPYQPNSILALCVRICRDTLDEWKDRPCVAFLTHEDCPSAWIEEAKDCAAVGVIRFMHRTLGPMEEWDEEGIEKIEPFANEMIREAQLARVGGPAAVLDPMPSAAGPGEAVRTASANTGPKVFISYAHADKDKEWYKALFEFLQPLRQNYPEDFWSDVEIEPGNNWFQTISDALTSAPIVIFVVSPALLASPFVTRHELAPALKDNKRILWIHGQASLYKASPFSAIQAAHDVAFDLETANRAQRKEQLNQIAAAISAQLEKFVQYSGVPDINRR